MHGLASRTLPSELRLFAFPGLGEGERPISDQPADAAVVLTTHMDARGRSFDRAFANKAIA